jgi:hypothetical protein
LLLASKEGCYNRKLREQNGYAHNLNYKILINPTTGKLRDGHLPLALSCRLKLRYHWIYKATYRKSHQWRKQSDFKEDLKCKNENA